MIPRGAMPHPWWMFWQIGNFLIMVTVVVLFLRFVVRSDRASGQEAEGDMPADSRGVGGPGTDPPAAH